MTSSKMYPLVRLPLPPKTLTVRDDRSTNWNRDRTEGTRRGSQPCTFGEGYGNCLLLDPPKYVKGEMPGKELVLVEEEEERRAAQEAKERKERRVRGALKAKATRAKKEKKAKAIRQQEGQGVLLLGRRVFLMEWAFDDWGSRGAKVKLPEGTQLVNTGFGGLLVVPVIEESEGDALGLTEPMRDTAGRRFWVPTAIRETVEWVFGRVQWKRPLSVKEVTEQFGVKDYLFGGTC